MSRIEDNLSFSYSEALLASVFAELAYNHRNADAFSRRLGEMGWQGITPSALGANGFSTSSGGYGVRDGLTMQSYAFAGTRKAADGTEQFVLAFEGSNSPIDEPADWLVNVGAYGWSRYYASLQPLIKEVISQILALQQAGTKTQLILTGHSLGGAAAMVALADLLAPAGNLWPGSDAVLAAGQRLWDNVSGWNDATRKALLDATSLYSFGAPSF
jgi:dienelactone hydrolase